MERYVTKKSIEMNWLVTCWYPAPLLPCVHTTSRAEQSRAPREECLQWYFVLGGIFIGRGKWWEIQRYLDKMSVLVAPAPMRDTRRGSAHRSMVPAPVVVLPSPALAPLTCHNTLHTLVLPIFNIICIILLSFHKFKRVFSVKCWLDCLHLFV